MLHLSIRYESVLVTWMTEQPLCTPQIPLLAVYCVHSLSSAGEPVVQALWHRWDAEQGSVGRCICAKWLGGGRAQHDAPPACPPLPLQQWWVLPGLVTPQIPSVPSIPDCCSGVDWERERGVYIMQDKKPFIKNSEVIERELFFY